MATDTLAVPNAAQIQWAVFGSNVFFRNLNDFDSSWLGCCYNYWLDLTTDGGRAMFAAFLTARTNGSAILLTVPAKGTASAINQLGNW
ncbi:hypothetical protein [Sphingomonas changbaiensis]|nr:hypothetical protein [Sphingomonas changbaiensis]